MPGQESVKWLEVDGGWTVHNGQHWETCRAVHLGNHWRVQYANSSFAHLVTDPVTKGHAAALVGHWRANVEQRGLTLGGDYLFDGALNRYHYSGESKKVSPKRR